jgi:hypothetical protein
MRLVGLYCHYWQRNSRVWRDRYDWNTTTGTSLCRLFTYKVDFRPCSSRLSYFEMTRSNPASIPLVHGLKQVSDFRLSKKQNDRENDPMQEFLGPFETLRTHNLFKYIIWRENRLRTDITKRDIKGNRTSKDKPTFFDVFFHVSSTVSSTYKLISVREVVYSRLIQ